MLKVKLSQAEEKLAEYESQPSPTENTTPLIEFDTPIIIPTTPDKDTVSWILALIPGRRERERWPGIYTLFAYAYQLPRIFKLVIVYCSIIVNILILYLFCKIHNRISVSFIMRSLHKH